MRCLSLTLAPSRKSGSALFEFRPGSFDHLLPLLALARDLARDVLRRPRGNGDPEVRQACAHSGIERTAFTSRFRRSTIAADVRYGPKYRTAATHRSLRHPPPARARREDSASFQSRDRERAQRTRLQMRLQRGERVERHLHVACDEVRRRRAGPLVWNVHDFDSCRALRSIRRRDGSPSPRRGSRSSACAGSPWHRRSAPSPSTPARADSRRARLRTRRASRPA